MKKIKKLLAAILLLVLPLAVQAMPGESLYMVHNDHLGTPKVMTDMNGDVAWTSQADPFGQTTLNEDVDGDGTSVTLNVRFPGQYFDQESGLHYNYHRYYDPSVGRYITSDPIGLNAGVNTYGYVGGNPTSSIDPMGLEISVFGNQEQTDRIESMLDVLKTDPDIGQGLKDKISAMEQSETTFQISGESDCVSPSARPGTNQIFINPDFRASVRTKDGGIGVIESHRFLAHEIAHLYVPGQPSISTHDPALVDNDPTVNLTNEWMSDFDGLQRDGYPPAYAVTCECTN